MSLTPSLCMRDPSCVITLSLLSRPTGQSITAPGSRLHRISSETSLDSGIFPCFALRGSELSQIKKEAALKAVSLLTSTIWAELCLHIGNNYPSLRFVTLGMGGYLFIVDERKMNYSTVIGIHGGHRNASMLLLRSCRG